MIEEYLIKLKPEEMRLMLQGVYELPFKDVHQLVGVIHMQVTEQERGKEPELKEVKKASKTPVSEVKNATQ